MGNSEKLYSIPKLKGSENYITWSLRMEAFLIKEKLISAISIAEDIKSQEALANIRLLIEDGPLLQIKHYNNAKDAWDFLKNLYNSSGFTSEFLLIKEFFNLSLEDISIEKYLNKIKELKDELLSRDIKIPEKVIITWILHNLDNSYFSYITSVSQALRNNPNYYTLETLSSSLLDESKRLENNGEKAFLINKKPWKKTKVALKCSYCKLKGHLYKDCYFLHPNKAPKGFKVAKNKKLSSKEKKSFKKEKENNKREEREKKQEDLLIATEELITNRQIEEIPDSSTLSYSSSLKDLEELDLESDNSDINLSDL